VQSQRKAPATWQQSPLVAQSNTAHLATKCTTILSVCAGTGQKCAPARLGAQHEVDRTHRPCGLSAQTRADPEGHSLTNARLADRWDGSARRPSCPCAATTQGHASVTSASAPPARQRRGVLVHVLLGQRCPLPAAPYRRRSPAVKEEVPSQARSTWRYNRLRPSHRQRQRTPMCLWTVGRYLLNISGKTAGFGVCYQW